MNLRCANGLPGQTANEVTIAATLEQWAERVRTETARYLYKFKRNPAEYNHSEAYFRVLVMITVLQQDFDVHYNPSHVSGDAGPDPDETFFADSQDLFLHGILGPRRMGLCFDAGSLRCGRRKLGYPIKLVIARHHLFARWESVDGKERFNIEATNQGLTTPDDDYYKSWVGAIERV